MEERQGSPRRQTGLYRWIIRVMNAGFVVAIALIAAGLLIGVVTGDHVAKETDNLGDVLPGAARLKAQDVVELGILTLVATPVAYVVAALFTFLRQRDVVFVVVCLALIGILTLSVVVAL
jgi:uncharacterized membrane protein